MSDVVKSTYNLPETVSPKIYSIGLNVSQSLKAIDEGYINDMSNVLHSILSHYKPEDLHDAVVVINTGHSYPIGYNLLTHGLNVVDLQSSQKGSNAKRRQRQRHYAAAFGAV